MKSTPSLQRGTSLVEVLVTLALGLIVSAGAIAMVISNREAYRSTEAVSRIQESTRVAFEIMSRDLRLVGVNACNGGSRVLNVLDGASTRWWSDWSGGLRGFDETTASLAASVRLGHRSARGRNGSGGGDARRYGCDADCLSQRIGHRSDDQRRGGTGVFAGDRASVDTRCG
jgi:Tfp pilus assembly protein PilW